MERHNRPKIIPAFFTAVLFGVILAFLGSCSSPAGSDTNPPTDQNPGGNGPSFAVTSIKLTPLAILDVGSSRTLVPVLETTGNGTAALIWSSSDTSVVTVTQGGIITAVGTGGSKADIIVTVSGSSMTARCVAAIVQDKSAFDYQISGDEVTITGYKNNTDPVVVIPEQISGKNVVTIRNSAFNNKSEITNVYLPSTIKEIGYSAFLNCEKLQEINMPAVTVIGDDAFAFCYKLTVVYMPLVETIGEFAFRDCRALIDVDIPAAIEIKRVAFVNCGSVLNIYAPAAVTVGAEAFSNCLRLAEINLSKAATIGPNAFSFSPALASITVGALRDFDSSLGDDSAAWVSFYTYYKSLAANKAAGTYKLVSGSWTGPVL
ncbi:leucine-rich repeat protein [Breznakiella homolactica]|uniref:Leucine-rich repeat protein n=1 Tax=Breznakiella homolactica TaxID=2798577 RepID=A0A7T7XKS0_9SPIR|nr:leucine-rich repeat protein [Breznakiella homolactica]QQO08176.1 leucine-rich repeat protein [Breznakiella homolactica]